MQRRLLAREKPRIQAAPTTQPHRSIPPHGRAIAWAVDLREFDIGVILRIEQIDVRHLLLADSPPLQLWDAAILLFQFRFS